MNSNIVRVSRAIFQIYIILNFNEPYLYLIDFNFTFYSPFFYSLVHLYRLDKHGAAKHCDMGLQFLK